MNLKELEQKIDEADLAYYTNGSSLIDDSIYDSLKENLRVLDPKNIRLTRVGAQCRESILEKRQHKVTMSSLDKVDNWDDFKKHAINTFGGLDTQLHASYKADGGSYSFEYKDGRLIYAISRGDGSEGEDITANAHNFRGLPKRVTIARFPFNGTIRGEVILDNISWKVADPDLLTNPRNTGVGIASRKDGSQSNLLRVLAFRIYDENGKLLGYTEEEQQQILNQAGFETITSIIGNTKQVWDFYTHTHNIRKDIDYWIDGIVVKINDLTTQVSLGETTHHPKGQLALKFPVDKVTSILRGVTLQVGQTGTICPVGNFDTVSLGGASVCNATLHNWGYINTLDIAIGDTIEVIKAGDIIPKITQSLIKGKDRILIPEPTECPTCKSSVYKKVNISGSASAAIFCANDSCPSKQSGKINKFVSSLNIMGAGDIVIETLIKEKYISDAADLYTLKLYESVLPSMLFNGKVRFGEKRAENLLSEIENKRELELPIFLGALGIPGLGKRRVEIVQDAAPNEFDKLEDWFSDKLVIQAQKIGLPNSADIIHNEILLIKPLIEKFIKNGVRIKTPTSPLTAALIKASKNINIDSKGRTVHEICITGTLTQSRDYYESLIKQKGINWATSVKLSTTHLVSGDIGHMTTKMKKAQSQGVIIIDEKELNNILGI